MAIDADTLFKAMADRTRQRALVVLSRHELGVSELVEVLRQPQSTVSRHLKALRHAGLIRDRRQGNTVMYSIGRPADDGCGASLSARILEWVSEQELNGALRTRLDAVLQRRQGLSDAFFTQAGRHWDILRQEAFGDIFHLEALTALLPTEWTVADLGTGTGFLLPALARQFRLVVGVEPVEEMLATAGRRVKLDALGNVELRRGDLSSLPMDDGTVDVALAVLVLHHVPSPRDALAEMHRIVRPGGRILIVEQTAHDYEAFRRRMQDHWWGFEPAELERATRSSGFERVRTRMLATAGHAAGVPALFVVTGHRGAMGSH
ncbi:MAG: ArsR/SmtB family transcription factor [Phycisphaerae bacterium]